MPSPRYPNVERVGLPARTFLYTVDQVAGLVDVEVLHFMRTYVYYEGRSTGVKPRDKLLARNIAPQGRPSDWRIAEVEVVRWLKNRGFRFFHRDWPID